MFIFQVWWRQRGELLTGADAESVTYADGNARVLVAHLLAGQPDATIDAGVALLRSMARTSFNSMTETEFNSLLACAAHRERIVCPSWRPNSHGNRGDQEYAKLHRCLSDHDQVNAAPAIHGLLNAVADQMAALIGERLTFLEFRRALESISTANARPGAPEGPLDT